MINSTISIITDQLRQYSDVKLIYLNSAGNNIKCTVIRNTDNLTEDKSTCIGIIANFEIARELLSKSNVNFSYEIKTVKDFKAELAHKESITKEEYDQAEIVYKRKNKTR